MEVVNISNHPASDGNPVWSPDNNSIAFVSERDGNSDIYRVAIDGSQLMKLTTNPLGDGEPSWSPDGSKIAFSSRDSVSFQIYIMDNDGSNAHRLTNIQGNHSSPSWSPDGSKIAFISRSDFQNTRIYILDVVTAQASFLTTSPCRDYPDLVWSPDSESLAFIATCKDQLGIYVVDVNNPDLPIRLTANRAFRPLSWSFNGEWLAFQGIGGLYAIHFDTRNLVQLQSGSINNSFWSPAASTISFMMMSEKKIKQFDLSTYISTPE
jgi:TolB protein